MKLLKTISVVLMGLFLFTKPITVQAETAEPETEQVEVEQTEEQFIEEVKNWLTQYADESLVAKIISWAVDAGVLSALFCVVLKYRKYKHTTTEDLVNQFKGQIKDYLKENFADLSATEIKAITGKIADLDKSLETVMKVLVLMQDTTANGKVALIDYLGSKTNKEEVKEVAEQVKETVEEEIKLEQEINDKVKGDYEEIF